MKAIKGKPFFRGVKIAGHKALTSALPAELLGYGGEIAIPVRQHAGAPAEPVVAAEQHVRRGELIARASGAVSANIHASVCGTVKAVEERADGRGGSCIHIVITPDGTQEDAFLPPLSSPVAEEILTRIEACGIVGMGGAGFPAHVKLKPPVPVDTLILNGAECEPYLTCDDALMKHHTEEIVRGAHYLAEALGVKKVMIAIERNKPEAIAAFEKTDLAVVSLKKQYPMGAEKQLIYCCTGRKVPLGKLPAHAGVVVQNVGTAYAVCEAVERGKPLIERIVTVSGAGIAAPKNLICAVGTSLSALIASCGGVQDAVKFVAGGPMTGTALTGAESVVTKTTGGFLFLTKQETNTDAPTGCINCGKCADVCPMKLMPMQTELYTNAKEYENADKYGGVLSCIECGACSYICPARRPLAQAIKTAKEHLRRKKA